MPAKCDNCGGILMESTITIEDRFDDVVVTVENVEALVCDTCGERLIPGPVLESIELQVENEMRQTQDRKHLRVSLAS